MPIYSTEIDGVVARIFQAEDDGDADSQAKAPLARDYTYPRLRVWGRPMWRKRSEVRTRQATCEEAEVWHQTRNELLAKDKRMERDEMWFNCFPYPVEYVAAVNP